MSFVTVSVEAVSAAASNLAGIGSAVSAANHAVATSTTEVLAAGADEVSAAVAALFNGHGETYRAVSAQATAFHDEFVRILTTGGISYGSADAVNASLQTIEQNLLGAINAPTQTLLGRPLIGNGANGVPGTGQNGGAGGLLFGNGEIGRAHV